MMRDEIDKAHETGCLMVMAALVLLLVTAAIIAYLLLK
jgi:hypothetical protein